MNLTFTFITKRALGLWFIAWMAWGAGPAAAGGLPPEDQQQVLAVVRGQLAALAMDDAAKAFSYAAPNIKQLVGNAQNFLSMVRDRYPVVYRPASQTFLNPVGEDGEAVLQVHMTDEDGDAWLAVYTLQKQKNKSWRITGCRLQPGVGPMI